MLPTRVARATLQQLLLGEDLSAHAHGNAHIQKVLHRIRICRTVELGYHLSRCNDPSCGHLQVQYHSCRDRHCPCCGAIKKQEWIEARTQELLPVKYYHVVFTLPHELNSLVLGNRKEMYSLLFRAASETLLRFSMDPKYLGATSGIIAVLHTWGQQLSFHPHLHCIVSGGGIDAEGRWVEARKNDWQFLFPVKAMAEVYRGKFLQAVKQRLTSGAIRPSADTDMGAMLNDLYRKNWVVYAKAPFAGPHTVIEYLGRYTHKVAISNHRLEQVHEDDSVSFTYKDYREAGKQKKMRLSRKEFIRRFSQHILPRRFTKIRSYGYLANRNRSTRINQILRTLKLPEHHGRVSTPNTVLLLTQYGKNIHECPKCKGKTMELIQVYLPWKDADDG